MEEVKDNTEALSSVHHGLAPRSRIRDIFELGAREVDH